MIVHLSAVVLLGVLLALLLRYRVLRLLDCVLSGSFGFLLASTSLAPLLHSALAWFFTTLGTILP
ncbi:hypothetical protein GXW82_35430 [Streptacidiphilus sp. 4-A2]|nr:hypothetical protein [Streptacidiphilus sp. 4-A2]